MGNSFMNENEVFAINYVIKIKSQETYFFQSMFLK